MAGRTIRKIGVFVVSPADVGHERALTFRVLEEINQASQEALQIRFEALLWENQPRRGGSIQDLTNSLLNRCDIFVLILGRRYGSSFPGEERSSTESELAYILHRRRNSSDVFLLCYFKELKFNPDPGPQLRRMDYFREEVSRKGVFYRTYTSTTDFETKIRADLFSLTLNLLNKYAKAERQGPREEDELPLAGGTPPANEHDMNLRSVQQENTIPDVFVTYSHDNESHIRWVHKLATNLVQNDVDVRFYLWDLHPGDDVVGFMERGVTECERVLVVCTPDYVRRVDEPAGGLGYEKTLITGEIVRSVSTKKFIPLLRHSVGDQSMPRCLASRLYIDFSDDALYEKRLDALLRELHNHPEYRRPRRGKSPFT
jgi:hypothetical protein